MMWLDLIFALYFAPMAGVFVIAAIHGKNKDKKWYSLMGWLAITPIVNIYVIACVITWYLWKGYHKIFDKKKE